MVSIIATSLLIKIALLKIELNFKEKDIVISVVVTMEEIVLMVASIL